MRRVTVLWVRCAQRAFLLCFLLNLSNIVLNMEGNGLGEFTTPFTVATLGNVGGTSILMSGGHTYAIIEVGTVVVLLVTLFSTRELMFEISERIQNGATRRLRAADFTVVVSHVPPSWSSNRLRAFFERWGEVVHVGVSLNYRDLILEIKQAQVLRNNHTDNLLDLATKMEAAKVDSANVEALQKLVGQPNTVAAASGGVDGASDAELRTQLLAAQRQERRGKLVLHKARMHAQRSHATVDANEKQIKTLMRQRYQCTGARSHAPRRTRRVPSACQPTQHASVVYAVVQASPL
jgi:hypothetical protein